MNRIPCAALALLLGVLALSGCRRSAPPAEEETPVAPVHVAHAEDASFGEWTELIGATQPLPGRVARVTAPVEGHVLSVLTDEQGQPVREGQPVKKGQVIVRLDDRVARANRDKAVAAIAELAEARKQADLAYQLASLDVDRLTKLNPPGTSPTSLPLVSKIEIEQARLKQQDAESKQRAVSAKEKTLKADLRVLEVHLEFHELRAPLDGVLGAIQVVPGQTLAVGAPVAEVTDLSEVDVVAFAPPRAARKLQVDQPAWFAGKQPGEADREGPAGKVVFIAEQAQPDTGNIQVKVRFPNAHRKLRANQVSRVLALTESETKRLTIPEAALIEDQNPPLVIVADDVQEKEHEGKKILLGKARRLRAVLGIRDRAHHVVEILRLTDPESKQDVPVLGTQFIVEGGHGLHDGDVVKVEAAKEH
jgi:RND family efflux transporter MFP subunit